MRMSPAGSSPVAQASATAPSVPTARAGARAGGAGGSPATRRGLAKLRPPSLEWANHRRPSYSVQAANTRPPGAAATSRLPLCHDVAVDAPLAVTFPRPGQIHRLGEGTAAIVRDGEQDLAAVRAAGKDDLLPEHMKAVGIVRCPGQPRQPREGLRLARHVDRGGQQRFSVGRIALQQHGLAPLVDPRHRELPSRAPRHGRIVDEVVARLVLLPRAAFAGAACDLQRGLPADLRGPAGGSAQQQPACQACGTGTGDYGALPRATSMISRAARYRRGSMLSTSTYSASVVCAPKPRSPKRSTTGVLGLQRGEGGVGAAAFGDRVDHQFLAELAVDRLRMLARARATPASPRAAGGGARRSARPSLRAEAGS